MSADGRSFAFDFDELVVDSFAGGGGASTGIEMALGRPGAPIRSDSEDHGMTPALERIGHIDTPYRVSRCRNVREARLVVRASCESINRVIGTDNSRPSTQLYGWAPNVQMHVDNDGFVYFVPIMMRARSSMVITEGGPSLILERGAIYRLDDRVQHGTYDIGWGVVCLFYGPVKEVCDDFAMSALKAGLDRLLNRAPGAPRVSEGFRFPMPGECWAMIEDHGEIMTLKEAKARDLLVITCAKCDRPAHILDHHFPYGWDGCLCAEHALKAADKSLKVAA